MKIKSYPTATCPPYAELNNYLTATAKVSRLWPDLDRHIDRCPRCQLVIQNLVPDLPSAVVLSLRTAPASLAEEDEGGQRLIAVARQIPEFHELPPATEKSVDFQLPHVIEGRYELQGVIGRGGMSTVYRAFDLKLKRHVAFKIIDPEKSHSYYAAADTLLKEAQNLAQVDHANVVSVYETGYCYGFIYLVMPIIEGGTLADCLVPTLHYSAATIVAAICEGVEAAHRCSIIHRDLKPSNILLTKAERPIITDFGLALDIRSERNSREVAGTADYMAPEQWKGQLDRLDERTDVYGIGGILHYLLTGSAPGHACLPMENRSQDLAAICRQCLHENPVNRYPSANAVRADLNCFLQGRPVSARHLGTFGHIRYWARRNAFLLALSIFVFGLAFWVLQLSVATKSWSTPLQVTDQVNSELDSETAHSMYERGTRYCDNGDIGDGLSLIGKAVELTPTNKPQFHTYRQTQNFWEARRTWHLHRSFLLQIEQNISNVTIARDHSHLLTDDGKGNVIRWNSYGARVWSQRYAPLSDVDLGTLGQHGLTLDTEVNTAIIFNISSGERIVEYPLADRRVTSIVFTDSDQRLVVASSNPAQPLRIFSVDYKLGNVVPSPVAIATKMPPVRRVVASTNGSSFASISEDGSLRLWSGQTGTLIRSWKPEELPSNPKVVIDIHNGIAALAGDGSRAVYLCPDGTCHQTIPIGFQERVEEIQSPVNERGFSILVKRNNKYFLRLWTPGYEEYRDFDVPVSPSCPRLCNGGVRLISPESRSVSLWKCNHNDHGTLYRPLINIYSEKIDTPVGIPLTLTSKFALGHSAVTTPDGSLIATVTRSNSKNNTQPKQSESLIRVYNGGTLTPVSQPSKLDGVACLAISPDGSKIAIGTEGPEGTVKVGNWNSKWNGNPFPSGEMLWENIGSYSGAVWAVAFNPSGQQVAAALSGSVVIHNLSDNRATTLHHPDSDVTAVKYSAQGNWLATGTSSGTVRIWNVGTCKEVASITIGSRISALVISRDRELLAVGTSTGWSAWRLPKDHGTAEVLKNEVTSSAISDVQFIEPGRILVVSESGSTGGQKILNTHSWQHIGAPVDDPRVIRFACTEDGSWAFTVTLDGQLYRRRLYNCR